MARAKKKDPVANAAIAATAASFRGGADYLPLVKLIEQERSSSRGRGRRPAWLKSLGHHSSQDLAAATLYAIVESHIRAQDEPTSPLLLSVSARLGDAVLPGADEQERVLVGVQLLGLTERAGIIEPLEDSGAGIHVSISDPTFERFAAIVNGGVRHWVRPHRPRGVKIKQPPVMKISRPEVPPRVEEAADKVQGTAWRINSYVLNTLLSVHFSVELATTTAHRAELEQMAVIRQAHSLRDMERFYFPAVLDFRGRLYQRGGLLTYTGGGDYARGLLEFAEGEVLDAEGMGWLTWHLAQMWGKDIQVVEFGDGRRWVADNEDWLRRCAADPVGNQDWRKANKHPAQFLAALGAWLDATQGKPCHLPVRLDASCSGLQHLALLSRDEDVARSVNLWGDTYDARGRRELAWLEISQPDFYKRVGGTANASRDQAKAVIVPMLYTAGELRCAEALTEARTDGKSNRPTEADRLKAGRIRETARQLAPGAFAVLDWFKQVAKAHNDATAERHEAAPQPIYWTTPSGFEAVQDYRLTNNDDRRARRRAVFRVGDRTIKLVRREMLSALDTRQQLQSLPANLVHSLDAALLVETVAGADIDSWAVAHDAFGVPAGQVAKLQDSLVEGLKAMYSRDLLGEWAEHWRSQGVAVPKPPGVRGPLPKEMLGGLRTIG